MTDAWSILNQRLSPEIHILLSLPVCAPETPRCCREIDPPRQCIHPGQGESGCDAEGDISLIVTDLWVLQNTGNQSYGCSLHLD